MSELKNLQRRGITTEAIIEHDLPEFTKADARWVKSNTAYKSTEVDSIVEAFYTDTADLLKRQEDLQSLADQYKAENEQLVQDIDDANVSERIVQIEAMLDQSNQRVQKVIEGRQRDIEMIGRVTRERDEALQRESRLKTELTHLKSQNAGEDVERLQAELEENAELMRYMGRNLNELMTNLRDRLVAYGVEFEEEPIDNLRRVSRKLR